MKVHFEKKIVVLNHQSVGTTTLARLLNKKKRGFDNLGGHHDGPWDLGPHKGQPYRKWWEGDERTFTYVYMVRNPFSAILTHWWQWGEPDAGRGPVTVEFLEEFMYRGIKYHPHRGRMWRFAWEQLPGPTWQMRFERGLREEYNRLFRAFDLPLIGECIDGATGEPETLEHRNATPGKPKEDQASHFTPGAIAWIEKHHAEELHRFRYNVGALP